MLALPILGGGFLCGLAASPVFQLAMRGVGMGRPERIRLGVGRGVGWNLGRRLDNVEKRRRGHVEDDQYCARDGRRRVCHHLTQLTGWCCDPGRPRSSPAQPTDAKQQHSEPATDTAGQMFVVVVLLLFCWAVRKSAGHGGRGETGGISTGVRIAEYLGSSPVVGTRHQLASATHLSTIPESPL